MNNFFDYSRKSILSSNSIQFITIIISADAIDPFKKALLLLLSIFNNKSIGKNQS